MWKGEGKGGRERGRGRGIDFRSAFQSKRLPRGKVKNNAAI